MTTTTAHRRAATLHRTAQVSTPCPAPFSAPSSALSSAPSSVPSSALSSAPSLAPSLPPALANALTRSRTGAARHATTPRTAGAAHARTAFTGCLAVLAGWFIAAFPADSARAAEGCVTVEVHHVRPQQGHLMAAAFGDADSFGKRPMAQVRVPAGDAVTRFELCGITSDTLSISMFQDLDSDGAMGRSLIGLPTEPWGSSGTPGPFGPSWETGKVPRDGQPIVVKLSQ